MVARMAGCRRQTLDNLIISGMADREGFEPSNGFHRYTLSRRAPSTTRPPVPTKNALKYTAPPRTARSPEREALQRLIACAASRQRRRCLIGDHRLTAVSFISGWYPEVY